MQPKVPYRRNTAGEPCWNLGLGVRSGSQLIAISVGLRHLSCIARTDRLTQPAELPVKFGIGASRRTPRVDLRCISFSAIVRLRPRRARNQAWRSA